MPPAPNFPLQNWKGLAATVLEWQGDSPQGRSLPVPSPFEVLLFPGSPGPVRKPVGALGQAPWKGAASIAGRTPEISTYWASKNREEKVSEGRHNFEKLLILVIIIIIIPWLPEHLVW